MVHFSTTVLCSMLAREWYNSNRVRIKCRGFNIPKEDSVMLKRLWVKALFMVTLLAGLVFLPGAACGSSTTTPKVTPATGSSTKASATDAPASTTYKVGDRVEISGAAVTIAKVSDYAGDDFVKPKEGNVYILVEVLVENVSQDKLTYLITDFKLKDADGYEYTNSLFAPDPKFSSGSLAKGEKVRGNVLFEVPATVKGLVMSYNPMLKSYSIKFDLGR